MNYGVSLPTIRSKAAEVGKDNELAKYLYKQQVRELRLAALHIAEPKQMNIAEADFWAEGVINSEIAEEMAFALLRYSEDIEAFFSRWTESRNKFLAHAAMMAAAAVMLFIVMTSAAVTAAGMIAVVVIAVMVAAHVGVECKPALQEGLHGCIRFGTLNAH